MVFKRLLVAVMLLLAPWALAGDQVLSAEFLQYLAEFSDDQGNSLDPELLAIAQDQQESQSAADQAKSTAKDSTPSASPSTTLPATPAAAGTAFSQGE